MNQIMLDTRSMDHKKAGVSYSRLLIQRVLSKRLKRTRVRLIFKCNFVWSQGRAAEEGEIVYEDLLEAEAVQP